MNEGESLHRELRKRAGQLRLDALEMIMDVSDGHPGASFSAADIITALYFGGILHVDPEDPDWEDRDRFVLSKGHACPLLYAALIRKGLLPEKEKFTLRKINSRLQGHPDMAKTPGIDGTTGPLGNGVAMAVGMAWALKLREKKSRVFALTGDGELQEGVIWEALQAAVKYELDNLCIIVDHNRRQSGGLVSEVSGIMPLEEKFKGFRLETAVIEGHDFGGILNGLLRVGEKGGPLVLIAETVKGKGVDFMEEDNTWHKRVPTKEEFHRAKAQLSEVLL